MAARLDEVLAIKRAIIGSLEYDEALRLVVDKTVAFTSADACALLLVPRGASDDRVRVAAACGVDADRAASFVARFDERIGHALYELFDANPDDAIVAAPVVARESIRGALVVLRRGHAGPDPNDEELIRALADQAAIALDHASRFRDVREGDERKAGLLAAIQSHTPALLAYLDPNLEVLEANAAFARAFGGTVQSVVGKSYAELVGDTDGTPAHVAEVKATRVAVELREMQSNRAGEAEQWWDFAAYPVLGTQRELLGIVVSAVDVTAKVRSRHALEVANRRKDEFIAMLAHELRNPLAAISSAVELLGVVVDEESDAAHAATIAMRQVGHMTRLLEDLLDVSRFATGRVELRQQALDLREVVQQAIEACGSQIDGRRHRLTTSIPDAPVPVHGDPDRLQQIVCNLVTNAAKYTDPGGSIEVVLTRDGETAIVVVKDDGRGIPQEALPQIFEPFMQGARTLEGAQGGLGIGLTIARRFASMHGGSLTAASDGAGRGSTFTLRLPLRPA